MSLLVLGELLSAAMILPSFREMGLTWASFGVNLVLLACVQAPFAVLFLFRRGLSASSVSLLAASYIVCHAYLVRMYLHPTFHPQEFGYIGLALLPFYESVIALPLGLLAIWLAKLIQKSSH